MHHIQLCPIAMSVSDVQEERSLEGALTSECKKCLWEVKCDMQTCAGVNDIVRGQWKECVYFIFYFFITIQAREFLEGDWLKCVVFQPNLEHLHVGISFTWQPLWLCFDFQRRWRRDPQKSSSKKFKNSKMPKTKNTKKQAHKPVLEGKARSMQARLWEATRFSKSSPHSHHIMEEIILCWPQIINREQHGFFGVFGLMPLESILLHVLIMVQWGCMINQWEREREQLLTEISTNIRLVETRVIGFSLFLSACTLNNQDQFDTPKVLWTLSNIQVCPWRTFLSGITCHVPSSLVKLVCEQQNVLTVPL